MVATSSETSSNLAVFIDLENVVIGARTARFKTFDFNLVLQRLLEKGNVVVRRAYADWSKFESYKRPLHEAGVELTDIPGSKLTGKNSADIKMVVDALELSYTKAHIDTFAFVTGDSDFSPLVTKLRENNRHTIGIGVKNSTSKLLIDSCDEFLLYDDLVRKPKKPEPERTKRLPKKKREAFELLLEAAEALQREDRLLVSSALKDTMKRKQPQFNEEYHGYSSFSRLLEDAARQKVIKISKDARSGTYVIDELLDGSD